MRSLFHRDKFPITVNVYIDNRISKAEFIAWAEEHFGPSNGKWDLFFIAASTASTQKSVVHAAFTEEKDATFFLLRWG